MKRKIAVLLGVLPGFALAQVNVFSTAPDVHSPLHEVDDPAVAADYVVAANIRGMAENLIRARPQPLVFALPGLPAVELNLQGSAPLEGFTLDEDGSINIPPGTPDSGLSFNLYGVAWGKELSLVVHRGRVTGSLTGMLSRPGQAWTVVESKKQLVLRDLDTSKTPPEPDDRPKDYTNVSASLAPAPMKRAVDGGGTVSIVVMHTANAALQAGGIGPMEDLIRGSFADLDIALGNSEASRVRIQHILVPSPDGPRESEPVAYDESPAITNVEQRWYAHRRWARVNPVAVGIRDFHQADLVVLAVGDAGTCGVAYTQRPDCGFNSGEVGLCDVGAGYVDFASAVISTRPACGLPTRTLAHEVGHQFGMEHDPRNGSPVADASFPWSYGHTVSTAVVQARSIMAYERLTGPFMNCPNGCPIQLHFSNPAVDFTAFPGTPSGTVAADAQGRHSVNARTAVLYAPRMETFRGPATNDLGIFGHSFESLPDIVCDPAVWANCPVP